MLPECAARCTLGISLNTLLNWMKVPEFHPEYREARRAAYSQAVARLQQGATAAVTTPLNMMLDQGTAASVTVRAAECVMNHLSKAIEIVPKSSPRVGETVEACIRLFRASRTLAVDVLVELVTSQHRRHLTHVNG